MLSPMPASQSECDVRRGCATRRHRTGYVGCTVCSDPAHFERDADLGSPQRSLGGPRQSLHPRQPLDHADLRRRRYDPAQPEPAAAVNSSRYSLSVRSRPPGECTSMFRSSSLPNIGSLPGGITVSSTSTRPAAFVPDARLPSNCAGFSPIRRRSPVVNDVPEHVRVSLRRHRFEEAAGNALAPAAQPGSFEVLRTDRSMTAEPRSNKMPRSA